MSDTNLPTKEMPLSNPAGSDTVAVGSVLFSGVSKRFRKATMRKKGDYSTVKSSLVERFRRRRSREGSELIALDNISVTVAPGQALGVIGRNGSGKSTLLKLIAGIYRPDAGRVAVNGKISALIELGAGFHPDFTGRENVYLGGVMFGLTKKEIESRFDAIVSYAELEDFIDDPVRTYSSGMYMRLGFSLAVHTDPDILIIDEVLAVGDAGFINRCHDTISEFKRRGKTLIFVTHDLESVKRWCDEALWLDKGVVRESGDPAYVIDRYLEAVDAREELSLEKRNTTGEEQDKTRWGSREVEITVVRMLDERGEAKWLYHPDEPVTIELSYLIHQQTPELAFGIGLLRADGLCVHGTNTEMEEIVVPFPAEQIADEDGKFDPSLTGVCRYKIPRLLLTEGTYFLDVAVHREDGYPYDYHHMRYQFSVRTHRQSAGIYSPDHYWEFQAGYPVSAEPKRKIGGRS